VERKKVREDEDAKEEGETTRLEKGQSAKEAILLPSGDEPLLDLRLNRLLDQR